MNQKFAVQKLLISIAVLVAVFVFGSCSEQQPKVQDGQQINNQDQQTKEVEQQEVQSKQNEVPETFQVNSGEKVRSGDISKVDWTVHSVARINFDVAYPNTWKIIELSDPKAGIVLRSPNYISIRDGNILHEGELYLRNISSWHIKDNVEDTIRSFNDGSNLWLDKYKNERLSINGYEGIIFPQFKEEGSSYFRTEAFFEYRGQVVVFSYLYEKYDSFIQNIFMEVIRRSLK